MKLLSNKMIVSCTIILVMLSAYIFSITIGNGNTRLFDCQDFVSPDKEILGVNSDAGAAMIDQFAITPAEALEIAIAYQRRLLQEERFAGRLCSQLYIIVDGKYVITPKDKVRVELQGYYVDGMTGEVSFVESEEYVCYDSF